MRASVHPGGSPKGDDVHRERTGRKSQGERLQALTKTLNTTA